MPDYGPDPDREVSGSWGPGDDTGLVPFNTAPVGVDDNHWPWAGPHALMIAANLGSLAADEHERVWITERDGKPGDGIWFAAKRSSDGNDVVLLAGMSDGAVSAEDNYALEQPWYGPDHVYAWALRITTGYSFPSGTIHTTGKCSPQTGGFNFSGTNGGLIYQSWGNTGFVPVAAKSDARVRYVAVWWDVLAPQAPTSDQLVNRLKQITCHRAYVGFVGSH